MSHRQESTEQAVPQRVIATIHQWAERFSASPDSILLCDGRGRILYFNDQLAELFGYDPEQLVGEPVELLLPDATREAHVARRDAYLSNPATRGMAAAREVQGRRADGTTISIEVRLRRTELDGTAIVVASIRDVSEQRLTDAIRALGNRTLRKIAAGESAGDVLGSLTHDLEQIIVGGQCAILAWDDHESHPRCAHLCRLPGAAIGHLLTATETDMSSLQALSTPTDEQFSESQVKATESMWAQRLLTLSEAKRVWVQMIPGTDGQRLGVFLTFLRVQRSPRPRESEFLHAATDLARIVLERERRSAELREKEVQLRRTHKLESLGALAAGITREFDDLLQVILGYTELALNPHSTLSQVRADLAQVRCSAESARELTSSLLKFSHGEPVDVALLDVNRIVKNTAAMIAPLIERSIEVHVKPCQTQTRILANEHAVARAIIELCLNAQEAMPQGGPIDITLQTQVLTAAHAERLGSIPSGNSVIISIRDGGVGMSNDVRSRIFEPFFTTKPPAEGRGMGLSTVYATMRDHRGVVTVDSKPGCGTEVRLYFPSPKSLALAGPVHSDSVWENNYGVGTERILIAESNPQMQQLLRRVLEAAGYRVEVIADHQSLLSHLSSDSGDIDLLIYGYIPARHSPRGEEILKRGNDPLWRVICLGSPDCELRLQIDAPTLPKPFKSNELLLLVRTQLDGIPSVQAKDITKLVLWNI